MKLVTGVILVLLGLGLVVLPGCTVVKAVGDFIFGVSEGPDGPEKKGGSIAETIAGFFGLTSVAGGLGSLYLNARRGNWVQAGKSMALGLNNLWKQRELVKLADGTERWVVAANLIFDEQVRSQKEMGTQGDVRKLVEAVEKVHGDPDAPEPAPAPTS